MEAPTVSLLPKLPWLALLFFSATSAADGQDMPRVRQTIRDLTSPALHGRGYVQQGDQKAASYLRTRFQALGLQPLTPSYTQPFTLAVNTFPGRAELRCGNTRLQPGVDFIVEPASGGGTLAKSATQLDTLVFSDEAVQQRFLAQPLRGQVVVLRQRDLARLAKEPLLAQHLDQASARITLMNGKLTASIAQEQVSQVRLQVLASKWPTSVKASIKIKVDAKLEPYYNTQNLIGYVRGRTQPDSFLVVTAHYDHLGQMGKDIYFPGANDNASGTAMLLELAAYYAQPVHQPAYSIAFIVFGAEEAGLLGSQYFTEHPLFPLTHIRFLMNLDLLGTGDEGITVVNGRLLESAFQHLTQLNDANHFVPQIAARGRAANSDHFPFSERGVPAFFLYTRGGITAYHDVYDRAETLPLTAFTGVFHLITNFLAFLGG
ncbi:M28 family metallopeptidase [Hymenobacter sp. GOD-10R]|uniref:M28 family metallopeptidase n=1 Tax=Hymenobacter sp. GOD-10R TaxID=3093922 RepID=UPI002D7877FD|nr:M28 family peptidase [Hymenobacter sp. GOD-10R]WRQ29217.1 M28 family peptidase [Hymenobacter sp. GOD-10R]